MIVRWKRVGATEFVATYDNRHLALAWQPTEHRWQVVVDGVPTKQRFTSITAAMDCVEQILTRRRYALGAIAHVVQRPSSLSKVVRHA